jgi:hypothetical protein
LTTETANVVETNAGQRFEAGPESRALRFEGAGGRVGRAQLDGGDPSAARPVRWWIDVVLAVAGYAVYAFARSAHGHALNAKDDRIAARHGRANYTFEQSIHIDWERGLQRNLLPYKGLLQVLGGFYGAGHFLVTIGVLVWLLFRKPQFYRFWRNVLFVLTMIAVAIFVVYPAMPPRLLKEPGTNHAIAVDTLDKIGGLWSYNHGVLEHISDPFAPMPSLHLGWATWVALSLWFTLPARSWLRRSVVVRYPLAIYFTVIVTGTHFVIDGVAGMALTAATVALCTWCVLTFRRRRYPQRAASGAGLSPATPEL